MSKTSPKLGMTRALSHSALAGLDLWRLSSTMTKISYAGYRFPPVIIQQAIWRYFRFSLNTFAQTCTPGFGLTGSTFRLG
jgi:hypothetical protein